MAEFLGWARAKAAHKANITTQMRLHSCFYKSPAGLMLKKQAVSKGVNVSDYPPAAVLLLNRPIAQGTRLCRSSETVEEVL